MGGRERSAMKCNQTPQAGIKPVILQLYDMRSNSNGRSNPRTFIYLFIISGVWDTVLESQVRPFGPSPSRSVSPSSKQNQKPSKRLYSVQKCLFIWCRVSSYSFLSPCGRLFPLREQGLNFYAHELTQDEIKVRHASTWRLECWPRLSQLQTVNMMLCV